MNPEPRGNYCLHFDLFHFISNTAHMYFTKLGHTARKILNYLIPHYIVLQVLIILQVLSPCHW